MREIVYVLTNEAMPGYIKIGKTTDLERRMKELDNTSAPLPFECFYACVVKDMGFVEKQLHEAFSHNRVRSNREFFELSPVQAAAALKLVELENVTPGIDIIESKEDQAALDKARSRRSNFKFSLLNVPIGSELSFISDEKIKAVVVDDRHIKVNEKVTSTSRSAAELTNSKSQLRGSLYWLYEGETLDDRRRRIETE